MAERRSKPTDYIRLRNALESRGINIQVAGISLGHSDSYLYKVDYTGKLAEIEILGLKSLYGIEYDEIKPLPKPKPEPKPEPATAATMEPVKVAQGTTPALTMSDKLTLKELTDAVTKLALMVNTNAQQTKALTDTLKSIEAKTAKLDTMLTQPGELYKAIFIPTYNAVKTADLERADAEEKAKKESARRIDGSIDYSKLRRP